MGRIPEEIVSAVADRTDMLQVLGEYVTLKRAGRTWKGLCPFHGEKTPSFNVNPERGFFKCFGCGESGTVFMFLTKMEGWSFPEAVRHLAQRVGIEIPEGDDEDSGQAQRKRKEKERYQQILMMAQRWYEENLWGDRYPEAKAYLRSRGVDEEAGRAFGLGYAPTGWSGVLDALKARRVSAQECEEAGLALPGDRGHYDRFRGRLMFPVVDIWGKVLAFSGRVIEADAKGAKYINSPETRFYTKGSELYGLATTRKGIKSEDAALLVEGNFDVVTLYARGVQNAVAPLGTAMTERQARLLSRYTQRVYVAFDGDKAGQAATERSLPILLGQALDARVVSMPAGDDPDSLVRREGQEALRRAVGLAQPIVGWALERLLRPVQGAPIEEQVQALGQAAEILRPVSDKLTRKHYVEEIGRLLNLTAVDVQGYLRAPSPAAAPKAVVAAPTPAVTARKQVLPEPWEEGPPPEWAGAPLEEGAQAGPGEEPWVVERRAIDALEGFCLQILVDLPGKLGDFLQERFGELLGDERLVYLLERAWERRGADGQADFSTVAQQLSEELGDADFFDQVSTLICAERDEDAGHYEQKYYDTIVKLQERWWRSEKEKVDRQTEGARSEEEIMAAAIRVRDLNRLKVDLDVRLQRKRLKA
jgi:DNA primase